MARADFEHLCAGSPEHYSAYVGPPAQYDIMGASQLRLACALGLRQPHRLLDLGCGSLRAGRLFIMYLEKGCYYGIEPNTWLVEQAIVGELGGDDLVRLKSPSFSDNATFDCGVFGVRFDFILAQSIFSHSGLDIIVQALLSARASLNADGLIMATFLTPENATDFGGRGWIYPGCVTYREETILGIAAVLGLSAMRIPWFHPRQDWYLFAQDPSRLPSRGDAQAHLTGKILGAAEIVDARPPRTAGP